jgi:hypothetical protein
MSQITLINENEARMLEEQLPILKKEVVSEDQQQEDALEYERTLQDDIEENRHFYDPPVIHMLRLGDSMQTISKKYNLSVLITNVASDYRTV